MHQLNEEMKALKVKVHQTYSTHATENQAAGRHPKKLSPTLEEGDGEPGSVDDHLGSFSGVHLPTVPPSPP